MGKTCLNKLSQSLLMDCTIPQHGISELLLVYADDVESKSYDVADDTNLTGVTLKSGAFSYLVEGYKASIQAVEAIQQTDYSNAMKQTVTFRVFDKQKAGAIHKALLLGKFVVFAKMNDVGQYRAYGAKSPLELTGIDGDTNANGGYSLVTLSTQEGAQGDYSTTVTKSVYDLIKGKAK